MVTTLSPNVRIYRFILGTFTIFAIIFFLTASSSSLVSNNTERAKSTFDPSKSSPSAEDYPPNPHPNAGNSLQYADDSVKSSNKELKSKGKEKAASLPQFANDVKDSKDANGQNPKAVDKDTPIKEAPKPPSGLDRTGGFDAIKDSNRIYDGVPEKEGSVNVLLEEDDDNGAPKVDFKAKNPQTSVADCTKDPEYVIMIDAGSTGSRVHVYEFDVCYSPPKLNSEKFEMLKPGLSSFNTNVIGAAKSLDPLLNVALETIPKKQHACTPIAVKATAGLRLLGEEKSNNILKAVRDHLENDYPFFVVEGDGVSIMSGDEEGVYAWVTANYLLGNIGSVDKFPTAAVFDLGGGSTQIVFEPDFKDGEKMIDGEHKYEINFGNRDFTLYQFSHLGYGLMTGRNKINSLIVENAIKEGKIIKGSTSKVTLDSPCIPPGLSVKDVEVKLDSGESYTVDLKGSETSAGAQCRFLAESILKKDAECTNAPCSFNGAHQPSLVRTFKESRDLYVFSYFYDRTNPLGMPSSFTLQELSELAKIVCNGETLWTQALSSIDGSIKELKDEPQWCLDLSFQVALLHTGYDIPLHRELRTAKKIAGNELGWCLGASLPLLDKRSC